MTTARPVDLPVPRARAVGQAGDEPVCIRDPIWEDAGNSGTRWLRTASRYLPLGDTGRLGGDAWSIATRGDEALVLIADARGSGEAASPIARAVLTVFRTLAKNTAPWSTTAVITALDETVRRAGDQEDFVTAVVAHLHRPGLGEIACAGHPPPLLIRRGQARPLELDPAPPLGLRPRPHPAAVNLAPNDRLLLYTDGVSEASDETGSFFSPERHLVDLGGADLEVALDALLGRLLTHTSGVLRDDATMMLLAVEVP